MLNQVRCAVLLTGVATAALVLASACRSSSDSNEAVSRAEAESRAPATPPELVLDAKGEPTGIEHYHKWSDKIGQGGEPVGEQAYENLAALGYRTVISVDGAAPDVETAARYGLRYVHIPIGYDGVPHDAMVEIIKATQEFDGPVFFHCHHGLHRGPAAAGVARMACDGVSNADAVAGLKASGTSPKYPGLYRDVEAFQMPSNDEIAKAPQPKSKIVPTGTRGSMSYIDRRWDVVNASKATKWGVPANMPDIDPAHEVGMMENTFRDLIQREEKKNADGDAKFLALLKDAHAATSELETALGARDATQADAAYTKLKNACDTCHAAYRND